MFNMVCQIITGVLKYLRKYHATRFLHFKLLCYLNIFSVVSEQNWVVELAAFVTSHFAFDFGL